jgi:hypothetical protein
MRHGGSKAMEVLGIEVWGNGSYTYRPCLGTIGVAMGGALPPGRAIHP